MGLAHSPRISTDGLILTLDAGNVKSSYKNFISSKIYSSFSSSIRSSNYTVQYSDDNSNWTTAFTGIASNNTSCGIQQNTGLGDGSYGYRRYWRYVEGNAVASHHPRVSRIILTDINGIDYNLVVYTSDNCNDTGTYQVGTVSVDFATNIWTDLSGNSNTGTLNGPTYSTANGGSLSFDGDNDYVTLSSSQIAPGTGAFTWNFWAKSTRTQQNYSILFSGAGSNTDYGVIALNKDVGNGLLYYAGGIRIQDADISFFGNWIYVSFIGNGGGTGSRTLRLYKNGVQAGSTYTFDYNFTSTTPIIGANHSAFGECMGGNIANVTYYNRALSATEISQNYNALKSRYV